MAGKLTYEELEQRVRDLEDETRRLKGANGALMESEKRLSQIVQASSIPTFVIDRNHIITHCNKAFEKLRGLPASKIIGTHGEWLEATTPEQPLMADFIVDQAPEEEMTWYYRGRCRRSSLVEGGYEAEAFFPNLGEKGRWLFLSAAPLKDVEGDIIGAIETLQDISERKEAEEALGESEKRLSQIVQGSPIPTFVIDNRHLMTHCNRAYQNLVGIHAHEVIGTRAQWLGFYAEERPVMADMIVDGAPEEDISQYYGDKYRKSAVIDGAYEAEGFFPDVVEGGKWLYFTAAPILDDEGHIIGAIETLQDVTERKKAEEELRRSERSYRSLLDFAPYPIVVFTLEGLVSYLNPAFTETFGWSLKELQGKEIPYVPPGSEGKAREKVKQARHGQLITREETKRLTKDGRALDVIQRTAIFEQEGEGPSGELVILRDVTQEKRISRNNEAMLRISLALPEYPDLDDLLHYVNAEVKTLLETEGAIAILHDELKGDLFVLGAAYDDTDTQRRIMESRFSMDQLIAGRVIRSGEPIIVNDTSGDRSIHEERDKRLGYRTRNLLIVPLKSTERIIGAICAVNKKRDGFDHGDVEILSMLAGTVALSIENARFSEEVKKAYREVSSMNRAKDKVINHLSHELKTPIAVLSGSLNILARKLESLPEQTWKSTLARFQRNLERIVGIQYQVQDIMENKEPKAYHLLSTLLDTCGDELETLIAEEVGERAVIEKVRKRINDIFAPREAVPETLSLHDTVRERLRTLAPSFTNRQVDLISSILPSPPVFVPPDVLQKVIDGLIRNAVENTPDEGKIEISVQPTPEGTRLVVRDYGVGITEDARRRIFEGFFTTKDTLAYSSKRPFDFNAGGKGADLLRMKIFSERYHFKIEMVSARCRYIPLESDVCPGRISRCGFCKTAIDCHLSGGTTLTITFPPAGESKQ